MILPSGVTAMLEALDGVAYVVSPAGEILAVGRRGWEAFAAEAGAPCTDAAAVIGLNLFGQMHAEPVREVYRRVHEHVLHGVEPYVAFEYRCDSPDTERRLRMSVSRLELSGAQVALLYQSQVLSAVARPWMSLFEPGRVVAELRTEAAFPIVRLCSFCHRVASDGAWLEPSDYYAQGGVASVRVSHTVCPDCTSRMEWAA